MISSNITSMNHEDPIVPHWYRSRSDKLYKDIYHNYNTQKVRL